jgi:hypothetical protein
MKTILVERFPDGSFSTYDGNGYLSFCKDPLDACDRSWCLLERDANPNKDKGAVLVEYTVTATPTGRTNLFRHGRLIEMRFNQYNTEGYSAEALAMLNKAFESIMDANAETWADTSQRDRDLSYKTWQDAVAETLLAKYDLGERGDSLLR